MDNEFKSRQIYVNGRDSVCIIEFYLPEEAMVGLSILSEHGKAVDIIVEKTSYGPGLHEIEFEKGKCDGNSCFYRLSVQTQQGEIVDTKKVFLHAASGLPPVPAIEGVAPELFSGRR